MKIFLYHLLTFGLYFFYWCSKSREAVHLSAKQTLIPSPWFLAIPGLNYWWIWQYARALEFVSYGRIKASDNFLIFTLSTFLPIIIFSQVGAFIPDNAADNVSEHTAMIIVLVSLACFVILEVIGLALYCVTVQKKIDKLRI